MIVLTDKAAKKVKSLLEKEGLGKEGALRISVKNVGCSGFSYDLKFDNQVDPKFDMTFEQNGVKVVADKKSLLYLNGTTIDFNEDLMQGGFKFNNPISTGTCSCGQSFST